MAISWNGKEHRYSLHKILDKPRSYVMSRTEAEAHRDRIRSEIRLGTLQGPGHRERPPEVETALIFADVCDRYLAGHVRLSHRRPRGVETMEQHIAMLRRMELPASAGKTMKLEARRFDSITKADVEEIRRIARANKPRAKGGSVGANRVLARLRHLFNWAILEGYVDKTPFKRNGVTAIGLETAAETARHRRLLPGEEGRLLKEANPFLQDLIVAALETGCRRGELMSLTWGQVRWADNILLLPAHKTKTNQPRAVPMTTRLRSILELRKHDPAGQEHPPHALVFGNAVGEPVKSIKDGWRGACERAGIEGLTFHDLRREFGSRLLETPGVADHDVRDWLGHANITTTSRYLATTPVRRHLTLKRFEEFRKDQANATGADRARDAASAAQSGSGANESREADIVH